MGKQERRYEIIEHGAKPTPGVAQFDGYTVAQWCPTPDGSGRPEAVVLQIDLNAVLHINGRVADAIALRLKSRHACNVLIEVLERHRDEVFPMRVNGPSKCATPRE
jgi:hypothetical protein